MNSDEIKTNAIKFVIGFMTWFAARYLPPDANATLAEYIPTMAAGVVAFAAFGYGWYRSTNMKLVPEKATAVLLPGAIPPAPKGAVIDLAPLSGLAKVVGALLIGFLILHATSSYAMAQTPDRQAFMHAYTPHIIVHPVRLAANTTPLPHPKPAAATSVPGKLTATQVQTDPIMLLQQFTTSDLQAALADANAQTPPDTTSAMCYSALLTVVNSPLTNPLPSQAGIFLALQKARDAQAFLASLQSPNGPLSSLNVACAPLVMNVNATLLALGVTTGLVVGTGGIAIPALPGLAGILSILPIK